ncbi:hypothetical protein BLD44_000555 [Mastigocladus laminosus UU774]|nr:hypothetical protein B4U84_03570 [Westiellopsis prolifica IICB1]TFI55868.1 hypothetical protein BLD44_000555 [Mastigocladus laminosus UU774]
MATRTQKPNFFKPIGGKSEVNDQQIKGQRVKIDASTGLFIESSKWAKAEKTVSPRYRFTSDREQVSQIKKIWYIFPFSL